MHLQTEFLLFFSDFGDQCYSFIPSAQTIANHCIVLCQNLPKMVANGYAESQNTTNESNGQSLSQFFDIVSFFLPR